MWLIYERSVRLSGEGVMDVEMLYISAMIRLVIRKKVSMVH